MRIESIHMIFSVNERVWLSRSCLIVSKRSLVARIASLNETPSIPRLPRRM